MSLLSGLLVDSRGPVLAVGAVISLSCALIYVGFRCVYSPWVAAGLISSGLFSLCPCCHGSSFALLGLVHSHRAVLMDLFLLSGTLLCFDLCRVPVRLLSLGCGGFNLLGLVLALSLLSWQFVCSTWVSSLSSGCSHGPVLAVGDSPVL